MTSDFGLTDLPVGEEGFATLPIILLLTNLPFDRTTRYCGRAYGSWFNLPGSGVVLPSRYAPIVVQKGMKAVLPLTVGACQSLEFPG